MACWENQKHHRTTAGDFPDMFAYHGVNVFFFSGCTRPGYVKIAIGNGPIEIVDLPSYKMLMFHSFLYVYQRVSSDLSEVYPTLFSGDGLKSWEWMRFLGWLTKNQMRSPIFWGNVFGLESFHTVSRSVALFMAYQAERSMVKHGFDRIFWHVIWSSRSWTLRSGKTNLIYKFTCNRHR